MLKIKQLPVLNDNYIYLIVDKKTQITACETLLYRTCYRISK